MTLLQAILLAMLYWLAAGEIFVPFTYCFCDLMLISLLTGVILGDPVKGCIVGGTIQPLYLALTAVGGAMPVDKEAAGIDDGHGHNGRHIAGSGSGDFFGSCTDHGAAAHSKAFGYGLDGTSCG